MPELAKRTGVNENTYHASSIWLSFHQIAAGAEKQGLFCCLSTLLREAEVEMQPSTRPMDSAN